MLAAVLAAGECEPGCAAQTANSAPAPSNDLMRAQPDPDAGHFADTEKILRNYLASHPADADAHYSLAYVLFRENKPADSLTEYTAAARLRTPREIDLQTVALDYVLLDDYTDAEHWAHYALSLNGNDAETWYEMGRIEYTLNHFQQAADAFHSALRLDPASAKAENNLGLALEGLNQTDEALACYRKAIAMQAASTHPSEQPMLNLAIVLIDRNQLDEALPLLESAVQIAPSDWKILAQLGRLYSEKGDLNAARSVLEKAIAIQPKKASLHFRLGQIYKKSGEPEKAKREFATVRDLLGTASAPQQ